MRDWLDSIDARNQKQAKYNKNKHRRLLYEAEHPYGCGHHPLAPKPALKAGCHQTPDP